MKNLFNKTFFGFLFGFIAIILTGIFLLNVAGEYEREGGDMIRAQE